MDRRRVKANKWIVAIAVGGLFLLLIFFYTANRPSPNVTPEKTLPPAAYSPTESINALAINLYERLASETAGNLFFSPYSIASALAMTYGGARGETAKQMNEVLQLGGQEATHSAFSDLKKRLGKIQQEGSVELITANALWAQENLPINSKFSALATQFYESEVHRIDYQLAGAHREINQWIAEQTKGKIKNAIAPGIVPATTRLALVNTIYFKGGWASIFQAERTQNKPFLIDKITQVNVPMMSQVTRYNLFETESLQALEMPYLGQKISMLLLLPSKQSNLHAVEAQLANGLLETLRFSEQKVLLSIPRFTLEGDFSLERSLSALGMPLFFSEAADFSGMTESKERFHPFTAHKAVIEVNERGTEAAATIRTLIGIGGAPPPTFTADRPFLFLIRENSTGTILFIGRVMDPST
jgi:serpin B